MRWPLALKRTWVTCSEWPRYRFALCFLSAGFRNSETRPKSSPVAMSSSFGDRQTVLMCVPSQPLGKMPWTDQPNGHV